MNLKDVLVKYLLSIALVLNILGTVMAQPTKIVTSFTVLKNLVEQITFGVSNVQIFNIVNEDLDPHIYQPVPNDSKMLSQADLVFINGLNFEGWIERLITSSGYKGKVVHVSQTVKPRFLLNDKSYDPHAWHDVLNAIKYVEVINTSLKEKDPCNAMIYQKNTDSLIKELLALHSWIIDLLLNIPQEQKIVLTTHDAFWYFGERYGIKFISPLGISTDSEPSAKDVSNIINLIKAKKIKAIFIENLANPRLIQQIAKETKVLINGILYADSLSKNTLTYQEMLKHNALMIFNAITTP